MKYLRQFAIILFVSLLGELLRILIPLPITASVYGLVLMLVALTTGMLKVHQVKAAADFLIEIMPVMFIPAGVGLLDSWPALRSVWIPVVLITLHCYGSNRPGGAENHQKGRKKEWKSFSLTLYFLEQLSVLLPMKQGCC